MLEQILFAVFGAVAVVSAILVITRQNVVHSAMFLASTLLAVAGIFLTLQAEFLAGVQIIVYIGGILVLFVFVIMLISVNRAMTERHYNRQWTLAVVTSGILIVQLVFAIVAGKDSFELPPPAPVAEAAMGNSELVGMTLYTQYLLPFEIASILLLVAIVGAVMLSKRKSQVE